MRKVSMETAAVFARAIAAASARRAEQDARSTSQEGPIGLFHDALAAAICARPKREIARVLDVTPVAVWQWATFRAVPRPGHIASHTDKLLGLV